MQNFIDFLVNNYLWFLIISLILIFALIGYLVDTTERPSKIKKIEEPIEEEKTIEEPIVEHVEQESVEPIVNEIPSSDEEIAMPSDNIIEEEKKEDVEVL